MDGSWVGVIVGAVLMACGFAAMYRGQAYPFNYEADKQLWLFFGFIIFVAGFLAAAGFAVETLPTH